MPTTLPASKVDSLISPECQEMIRREIEEVRGAEVFFVGRLDRDLVIEEVEAYAFGNRRTVPALMQYARPGDVILHNHPSGNLEPSSADIEVSSTMGERGIGSYIINNECTEIRIVVKAMRPPRAAAPLEHDALARMLSPGGALARNLDGYEFRPQQIEMMRTISRALNNDAIAVIEAGTGTGKSMAYLLPAIAWSVKNNEKVVVATNTINLQEQLIEKDLPLLKQALALEFDAVIVKGRGNYLCKRKADYIRHNPNFLEDEEKRTQLEAIQAWIKTTKDGSLSDLAFTPDKDVWEQVMSESDNCLRTQCPFYQSCFFYSARRRAARANVLVVNHHLLMSDLAVRAESNNYTQAAVLPPFHRVIFDEAHHLEEVATNYFGARVSRAGLIYAVRRLASPKTGSGLLHFISEKIQQKIYNLGPDAEREWFYKISVEIMESHREFRDAAEEACDRVAMALDEMEGGPVNKPAEIKKRITGDVFASPFWLNETVPNLQNILRAGRNYIERLRELFNALHASLEKETPETMTPLLELRSECYRIETHLKQLVRFMGDSPGDCRWIEYRRRGIGKKPYLTFCCAPLEIADDLRERVLRRFRSVIMTSATLAVERKFDHFLDQVGAADAKKLSIISSAVLEPESARRNNKARAVETLLLDAPFDYEKQVYAAVPVDLPAPPEEKFAGALTDFLKRALMTSRGRALVLFTSYGLLDRTHAAVAPELEAAGYACLKQGTAGRTFLTESFRRDIGSILFATASFWEGVDVPGEALSMVVLTRLPFSVPNEPILEARVEA
ncbi:DEAD/DEAH box helicase family protein, partial [Candidatus Sumerlaeota bacterium]|nr:DEAD/DEAH box helicase family protein [Candidatus Sumerlaeota bacterium]